MPDKSPKTTQIVGASAAVIDALNHHATAASLAGKFALADRTTRMAERLVEENARLEAARAAHLAAGSLEGDIAALSSLANEAEQARAKLKSATAALDAARRLVSIIGRTIALLG
jgi:fumarylacetoacetate (FAA) hydrolase family protein